MKIIVIGAGLAGLTAAATLRAAGVDVHVMEAGDRIGGRIHALRAPGTGAVLADLGPTWVWPSYQPVVARLLRDLGLETYPQFNDGDAVILGYGPEPLRQPLPGQDGMVRIKGGPTGLVGAMARQVEPSRVRLSAPVAGIREDGADRVRVALASGEEVTADRVLVAVPLRVAGATLEMPWASPALLEALRQSPTWMSTHAKAVLLYDRPFWRDAGLSGRIASRTGPLVEAHDHCGPGGTPAAIFGFVGWPAEVRQENPDRLRQAILAQVAACFGPEAAQPVQLVVQDWASDPGIATPRDLAETPVHPEIGPDCVRAPHLGGRVRFAVSEAATVSPGLIEGALATGEQAAQEILGAIA